MEGMDWIHLARDRDKCGDEPSVSTKCEEFPNLLTTYKVLKKHCS